MKKLLIFSHAMELGGAERALLGLLENIDYSQYQVDLFLMKHTGELLRFIPKEVNVLPEIVQYTCLAVPMKEVLRKRQLCVGLGRLLGKIQAKRKVQKLNLSPDNSVSLEASHKYTRWTMPKISKEKYDLAISFLTPHYFVAEKVDAYKKIAWIHTDYSKVDIDVESEYKMWNQYDKIISISDAVTESFVTRFPLLGDKVEMIENMMAVKSIREQSEEFEVTDEMSSEESIKILSIGRFCHAKNFDNIPEICSHIIKSGYKVKWYLLGFGSDEELIRSKIKEFCMDKYVIILGRKENPYPYIKACDIYIQPSRYEGNCVSVHEAQLLGKPVIITNYSTAKSQLEDGVDGIIVPQDNAKCAEGIVKLLEDKELMEKISSTAKNKEQNIKKNIDKLEKFI